LIVSVLLAYQALNEQWAGQRFRDQQRVVFERGEDLCKRLPILRIASHASYLGLKFDTRNLMLPSLSECCGLAQVIFHLGTDHSLWK
jgi:hypothetical protein